MKHEEALFSISADTLLRILRGMILVALLLHSAALVLNHGFGMDYAKGFVPLVHVDKERNLPTIFAFLLLLGAAGLSVLTAASETRAGRPGRVWWLISAALFLVALDEMMTFHEEVTIVVGSQFDNLPLLAWIVPYGILVTIGSFMVAPWLLRLDRPTRNGLALAAGLFVGGALGMEIPASLHYATFEDEARVRTLTGDLLSTVEETMAFLGVTVFIVTLVRRFGGLALRSHHAIVPAD